MGFEMDMPKMLATEQAMNNMPTVIAVFLWVFILSLLV